MSSRRRHASVGGMGRADHIFVSRLGGLYTHHGIDLGDGYVVHYQGEDWRRSRVRRTTVDTFLEGGKLEVRTYEAFERAATIEGAVVRHASRRLHRVLDSVKGLPLGDRDPAPDAVIERAESRLGEGGFDFVFNNCEHFATWCKTGISNSDQIDAVWSVALNPARYWTRWAASNMTSALDGSSRPPWRLRR